jgi:hypothetical protein
MTTRKKRNPMRGRCYEAAFLEQLANPRAVLVHGVATGTGKILGRRIGHAWIEIPSLCELPPIVVDATGVGGRVEVPAPVYYLIGKIRPEECRRYTLDESRKLVVEHGHYGPWHESDGEHREPRKRRRKS